jgi:hypothetical protein
MYSVGGMAGAIVTSPFDVVKVSCLILSSGSKLTRRLDYNLTYSDIMLPNQSNQPPERQHGQEYLAGYINS